MKDLIKKILKEEFLKENIDFNELYSSMWDKMLKTVCMKYTKDVDKAQDFCQNGFLKVYNNLNKYDNTGSLDGWVRRIITNSIIDELRKEKSGINTVSDDDYVSKLNISDDEYTEPEQNMSDVIKVLHKLSPAYRKTFEMYYLDGLRHEDIAKELGVSINTSKTNLMKAKNNIKKLLSINGESN